jgi:methane/ammonia monooxygenase subunit C
MSVVNQSAKAVATGVNEVVDLRGMWIGLGCLNVFYLIVRIYEQVFGWRAGLDSFAPEFQTYWMSILWTEIPLELVSGLGLAGYLWKTRDRDIANVSPREEMRRLVTLVQWLVVYAVAI